MKVLGIDPGTHCGWAILEGGTIIASGKGNAKKDAMIAAARERFGIEPATDDEADAIFVAVALGSEIG